MPSDKPELIRSKVKALSAQVPLLYAVLIVSTIGVMATHADVAPPLLALYLPGFLCIACLVRLVMWWRTRHRKLSDSEAVAKLRATTRLAVVIGAAFTGWGLSLFPYGDAYAQSHVAFFMAVTSIACIFCLMHLRVAAIVLAVSIVAPFATYLVFTGQPVFIVMALNLTLVVTVMVVVLLRNYVDFKRLIESQRELVARNSETQQLSDENFRLANFNKLTGLPNRRRFFAEVEMRLERARRNRHRLVIGLIDLAGFKSINHVYGHAAGDEVLVEAGRRLLAMPGPPRFVARLGGDEFGVLLEGGLSDAEITAFGTGICESLRMPYVMPGMVAKLGGAVGLAAYPEAADNAQHLFERADYALFYAKQNRHGAAVLFSKDHEGEIYDFGRINHELHNADLERELSLVFQPIVDLDTQKTVGLEALARWHSPALGPVPPSAFIVAAERSGLIVQLTEVLLRKALDAAKQWPADIHVSFNLSPYDITSPEATQRVLHIIRASGLDPGRIECEITETAAMRDFEQACKALRALKGLGVRIALDDFGTGYSSLSHVHRLPLDKIKIDRSFILDIEKDPAGRDIVKTVIDLCRNLNLVCVVEGIEAMSQALVLRSLGCRLMQGYLFSKPLPPADLRDYLEADRQIAEDLPENVRYLLNPASVAL